MGGEIIMGKRKVVKWSLEEDNYLYENYSNMRMADMEKDLGRTAKSIYDRGGKLGLSRRTNKKTNEQFVKEFYSIFPKEEYILLSEYVSTHVHVEYYHSECGRINKSTPASLLSGHGCICKKTNSNKVYEEEFLRRIYEQGEGKYTITDKYPYIDTLTKIELCHSECGNTYITKPSNFFNGRRCPYCFNKGNSKGERLVGNVLDDLGINYIEQSTFKGMVNLKQLYYDFMIDDSDTIIEYQGAQHYEPIEYLGGYKKFESQVKRDNIKLNFAENNGYTLIEVPYYLDTYKKVRNYLEKKL